MKRSKIIVELIKNEVNVLQAMQILKLLLQDNKDKKIKQWLYDELNGYAKDESLPEYRIVSATITGNYIVGNAFRGLQCTNQPIPIKPEYIKEYTKIPVTSGLDEIMQMAIAEKEIVNHSLTIPLNIVLANQISLIDGEVISANRNLSLYAYANILNKIKSKLLSIFEELKKKYGNLDDYYIDFRDTKDEKEINKIIVNIIYDNSINIGNNNKIEKSTVGCGNEN